VTSEQGFFEVAAMDHMIEFEAVYGKDPASLSKIIEAKAKLASRLGPHVSSLLLDAQYGFQTVVMGAVPRNTGIVAALECEGYEPLLAPRSTVMRENWSPVKARLAGAGTGKVCWFYRPDLDEKIGASQRELIRNIQAECNAADLPLVVEPIWFPVPGEDTNCAEWRAKRIEGILSSALEAEELGVDLLKLEFPGYVDTDAELEASIAALKALNDSLSVPWVLLSAGVNFEQFALQVELASKAGSSGFMAGRSIWGEAMTSDPVAQEKGIQIAIERLNKLSSITRAFGKPVRPELSLSEAVDKFPIDWYKN
jgi:tagatose 1,6-diphosphate aldolase